jgi:succinate dehydrogenase / fumarate reductase, cytochrome b subunit
MILKRIWKSTVGKKIVMAVSGILLMSFLVVHLVGNLTLFLPDGGAVFNQYAAMLEGLGVWLYVAEAMLLAAFLLHVVAAVQVVLNKRRARAGGYAMVVSKGGPSKWSLASRSMIITGVTLFIFIPVHIWMFKYNMGETYPLADGEHVKDVYSVVIGAFQNPRIVAGYTLVMLLLGLHLRHGFWSALQSLGAMNPRWTPAIYAAGLLFALLVAGGFLVLPLYFFWCGEVPAPGTGGGM